MAFTWANPGEREIIITATFIDSEAREIHDGLGGPSQLNLKRGEFVPFQPYLQLDQALRRYIPTILGIQTQEDAIEVNSLCEKITQTEKRYNDSKKGLWHSIWYKIGDFGNNLDGWVALIPDAYGLAIVKLGLAVVFKLSSDSTTRLKKIVNTFALLRDALNRADPKRMSFRCNKEVADCADRLYQTVVDSIEHMILLTSKEKNLWRKFIRKLKHNTPPPPDADAVLQILSDHTKAFENAISIARDQAIERAAIGVEYTGIKTTLVHRDVDVTKNNTKVLITNVEKYGNKLDNVGENIEEMLGLMTDVKTGIEQTASNSVHTRRVMTENVASMHRENELNKKMQLQLRGLIVESLNGRNKIAERENALLDDLLNARNQLKELLLEAEKRKEAENAVLSKRFNQDRKRGAVVSSNRFCLLLAQTSSNYGEPPNIEHMFEHPNEDLERVLVQSGRIKVATQEYVQVLLRHDRFLQWMNRPYPDLILVDASIRSAGLDKLSAISVLCATIITSMLNVQANQVVAHFFCGLHTAIKDPWYGPNGLVRSLIMQLFMRLVQMSLLDLGFIDNRDYLIDLEDHDLVSLCDTLYSLVAQFPPDMTIYCIIDSISCFDKDRIFKDLEVVLEWLQRIVDDRSLIPIFKVLMTNPMHSTRRMKEQPAFKENPARLINLSTKALRPLEVSGRTIERHLLRPATPTLALTRDEGLSRMRRRVFKNEFEEGWQTE